MSGLSNVTYWLEARGIPHDERLTQAILAHAKTGDHVLSDAEIMRFVRELG